LRSSPTPVRGAALAVMTVLASACASSTPVQQTLRIGAIFPLAAADQPSPGQELTGVRIAVDLVNAAGGAQGRRLELDVRDVDTTAGAQPAADSLRADGVTAVIGAYSSSLSIAASSAVAADGMVYWESGAVADQLTGRGLPLVFRVGANGADLGGSSGRFVASQLAPRLQVDVASLRAVLVTADDVYAHSVSDGARAALQAAGVRHIVEATYDPYAPDWSAALNAVAAARTDVVLLSSHVPDGVAFRRAFVGAGLHAGAFIATTMAQCPPTFGDELGAAAVGVFASDRPDHPFNPAALSAPAQLLYNRFAAEWQRHAAFRPTDEALAGFSSAWALFDEVLPRAKGSSAAAIAGVARALDLPAGTLPDGAGVRFETSGPQLGQNTRAAAVVEQWQSARDAVVVWPPIYANGTISLITPAT